MWRVRRCLALRLRMRALVLVVLLVFGGGALTAAAAPDCTRESTAPFYDISTCEDQEETSMSYDVFPPTSPDPDLQCFRGHNIRGNVSTNGSVSARREGVHRCESHGQWSSRDVEDFATEEVGTRDTDADGSADSAYLNVCSYTFPIVFVVYSCFDSRSGHKEGIVQVLAPLGAEVHQDGICARIGIVDAHYEGDGAAPDTEAGAYYTLWCASTSQPGTLYVPQSPQALLIVGVRDVDGDGVPEEPYTGGELLP